MSWGPAGLQVEAPLAMRTCLESVAIDMLLWNLSAVLFPTAFSEVFPSEVRLCVDSSGQLLASPQLNTVIPQTVSSLV